MLNSAHAIAIVGGGFSGALMATYILRHATTPVAITLIERQPTVGQGIAYSTPFACHLLNVPAGKMSAFPDQPDHFLRWLHTQSRAESITAATFADRRRYGAYIQAVLAEAQTSARPGVTLTHLTDEVEAIHDARIPVHKARLQLKSGGTLEADQVVLALGNFAPGDPPVAESSFYQSQRYIGYAWSAQALQSIAPDEPLLLIGSGLTMVDWAIALNAQGHRCPIQVVSRRGLLPQPHQAAPAYPPFLGQSQMYPTTHALMRRIRQEVQTAIGQGFDWRAVIDALRSQTPDLWRSLPLSEQRRFLRHARPYWEVHRHRIAPQVHETIASMRRSGQLVIHAGRIQAYQETNDGVQVSMRRRGSQESVTLSVSKVVNCTGPECNYRKYQHPLVRQLLAEGLIQPDALSLGLEVAGNGALVDANGMASQWLYTLGSPRKGDLWETTAVREIREQAIALTDTLLTHPSPTFLPAATNHYALADQHQPTLTTAKG